MEDWISWMELVQGQNGPMKARQILLVNPPKEFILVFKARMREHCQDGFSWRFNVVDDELNLDKYLTPGFEQYLPSDFPQGRASMNDLVSDFLKYRGALETVLAEQEKKQGGPETATIDSDASSSEDDEGESSDSLKPVVRMDRRAMMNRHSSLGQMNVSKRTLQAPRRRFNAGEKSSDTATTNPSAGRRGLLHRSNSVQTLGSGGRDDRRGGISRASSVRGGLSLSNDAEANEEEDVAAVRISGEEENGVDAPDKDEVEEVVEEEEDMLQHLERARRRHSLNMSDTNTGSKPPRSSRAPSRRHLMHRTNSAQNVSASTAAP